MYVPSSLIDEAESAEEKIVKTACEYILYFWRLAGAAGTIVFLLATVIVFVAYKFWKLYKLYTEAESYIDTFEQTDRLHSTSLGDEEQTMTNNIALNEIRNVTMPKDQGINVGNAAIVAETRPKRNRISRYANHNVTDMMKTAFRI